VFRLRHLRCLPNTIGLATFGKLENAIERAVLLAREDVLSASDFHLGIDPAKVISLGRSGLGEDSSLSWDGGDGDAEESVAAEANGYIETVGPDGSPLSLEEIERLHIKAVLEQCDWKRDSGSQGSQHCQAHSDKQDQQVRIVAS